MFPKFEWRRVLRRRNFVAAGAGTSSFAAAAASLYYFGQNEENLKKVEQRIGILKNSVTQISSIFQSKFRNIFQNFSKPERQILLPDEMKEPYYQPKLTVVIELQDLLLRPEWTYNNGARIKKRCGLDFLIDEIGYPVSELIIFTTDTFNSSDLIDAIDPKGKVVYRLYRDSTSLEDGEYIKDLRLMNRDPRRIIFVDINHNSCKYQPDNTLVLKPWLGDKEDKTLFDLASFIKTIAFAGQEDVRETLKYYKKFDNPLEEYRKNQNQLDEMVKKENARVLEKSQVSRVIDRHSHFFKH
ncbi:MAG: Mitochondrial import inner membrane translocase subunit TIM50 [Marteilia pararefringens]